jgi:hypothetical protein
MEPTQVKHLAWAQRRVMPLSIMSFIVTLSTTKLGITIECHYAECRYAVSLFTCCYAESRYADYRYSRCYAECHYADCCYAGRRFTDCRYTECHSASFMCSTLA